MLIATWIGAAIANDAARSRNCASLRPSTCNSRNANSSARPSANASCSAARRARASGSKGFTGGARRRWRKAMDSFPPLVRSTEGTARRVLAALGAIRGARVALDREKEERVHRRPDEKYTESDPLAAREAGKSAGGACGHQRIGGERKAPLRPAGEHEPLVAMIAMGAPEPFAPQDPAREGDARVDDEGRENEHRKPTGPCAGEYALHPESAGEEAERHRAGVAQKDPRRRKIERQESGARRGDRGAGESERRVCCDGGAGRERSEADDGHAARQSVGAIHEVEDIRHPRDREDRRDGPGHPERFP